MNPFYLASSFLMAESRAEGVSGLVGGVRSALTSGSIPEPSTTERKTRDVAGILHFLTPQQMAEEIVRLDAVIAGRQPNITMGRLPDLPCTVCGKPYSEHGSYPTCATHPYTPDANCQHVIGARCVGAECKNGCVRASKTAA